jgi:CheY-like chemotaxis protein
MAYLRDTPCRVDVAENGGVAWEMFATGHYDLVLMDRQMPVMDGLAATRAIRQWELAHNRAPKPIIALTASALKADREACLAAGCTAFLTKPIKQEALLQAIRDHAFTAASPGEEPVSLDPKFADLVPAFLENRRKDAAAILMALDRRDFEVVRSLAHGMRGAGSSFGFPPITHIGTRLEEAAANQHAVLARELLGQLDAYLETVPAASG